MLRVLDCIVGCGVLCAFSVPALASSPRSASAAKQVSNGIYPPLSVSGAQPSHVIVVDDTGSGPYFTIQDAVDAAQDGDTILVKHGDYVGFSVANKHLTVVGDGSSVYLTGAVSAQDLQRGKVLTLVHLRTTGSYGSSPLVLTNDAGRVRLDHCSFVGSDGFDMVYPNGYDAAVVDHCADVVFSHCTLRGGVGRYGPDGDPNYGPGHAGRGIAVVSSGVTIHESVIVAGWGLDGTPSEWDGGNGADACDLSQSTLYAAADQFTGGDGGDADFTYCLGAYGGLGGFAVFTSAGSVARMLRNTEVGGIPGCSQGAFCSADCDPQSPARWGAGFVNQPGWAAYLSVPTPVRENTVLPITVKGRQGDAVYLIRSDRTRNVYVPEMGSVSLVRPWRPEDVLYLGTLPGNDVPVTYSLELPDLGPGVESRTIYLQVMLDGPADPPRLGGVTALVVLDSAF